MASTDIHHRHDAIADKQELPAFLSDGSNVKLAGILIWPDQVARILFPRLLLLLLLLRCPTHMNVTLWFHWELGSTWTQAFAPSISTYCSSRFLGLVDEGHYVEFTLLIYDRPPVRRHWFPPHQPLPGLSSPDCWIVTDSFHQKGSTHFYLSTRMNKVSTTDTINVY